MPDIEVAITSGDRLLAAALSIPTPGPIRGGLVPLHPAGDPSREQFLFRHLAATLPRHGVAVLRFNRRPAHHDLDVPLATQARDALAALRTLRAHPDMRDAPIGLWGFSQGAWAAPLAAVDSPETAFLVLVASTGVSPAAQMRYGAAEQLRRAGFGGDALAELAELRAACETYLRGRADRAVTQALVDRLATRPWFPLAYIPRELPPPGVWTDMDFDPEPVFARIQCPVLLFYGEDDEWTPVEASNNAWRRAAARGGNPDVTVVRLPNTSHHPTLGGRRDIEAISGCYALRVAGAAILGPRSEEDKDRWLRRPASRTRAT